MALLTPMWMQNGVYPASSDRQVLDSLAPTYGYVGTGDFAVSQHGAGNLSVDVAPGRFWVDGRDTPQQGKYLCFSNATYNQVIATPPTTSGWSRIDRVVLTVRDSTFGGSNNDFIITTVQGTASASPSVPALPSTSTRTLAYVTVRANVTAILTADIQTDSSVRPQSWHYPKQTIQLVQADIAYNSPNHPTSVITATHDGTYHLSVGIQVRYTSTATAPSGHGNVQIQINGTSIWALATGLITAGSAAELTGAWTYDLMAGDQVNLQYANGGSAGDATLAFAASDSLTAGANSNLYSWFEMRQIAGGAY